MTIAMTAMPSKPVAEVTQLTRTSPFVDGCGEVVAAAVEGDDRGPPEAASSVADC